MNLVEPIYIENVDKERSNLVWVNPCVTSMMLEQRVSVRITTPGF